MVCTACLAYPGAVQLRAGVSYSCYSVWHSCSNNRHHLKHSFKFNQWGERNNSFTSSHCLYQNPKYPSATSTSGASACLAPLWTVQRSLLCTVIHCPNAGPHFTLYTTYTTVAFSNLLLLLLCILGLFLPPNFTHSFHYPDLGGTSVRIQSEHKFKY